jgi:hypothetical protein
MDRVQEWLAFMHQAQKKLLQGQQIDTHKPNIQIAIEPSFDKSTFLQLVLNDYKALWYRTRWDRLADAPKFSNAIEDLNYIDTIIEPIISYENGIIEIERTVELIKK